MACASGSSAMLVMLAISRVAMVLQKRFSKGTLMKGYSLFFSSGNLYLSMSFK
jgi:hypothetical protein